MEQKHSQEVPGTHTRTAEWR